MPTLLFVRSLSIVGVCAVLSACGGKSSVDPQPSGSPPNPSPPVAGTLTAPAPLSPANGEQLATLRPTLTVQNGSSTGQGVKTYEFQVSDRTDFTLGSSLAASFIVAVSQSGVPEGGDGRTTFTVAQD